jgi:hypothetical protein
MTNGDVGSAPLALGNPRGVGEILGEAFSLYKKNAVLLIATAAVAMGPVYFVKDAIVAAALAPAATSGLERDEQRSKVLQQQMDDAQARGASSAEIQRIAKQQMEVAFGAAGKSAGALAGLGLALLGILVTIPFLVLAAYLAQAALTVVVADRSRGGSLNWQGAWRAVVHDVTALIGTTLLVFLGVAIGVVLCVVPGFVFALLAAFTIPIVLLERKSGFSAIQRSIQLVRADWLRVVVVLVVFGLLQAVASWIGRLFVPSQFTFFHLLVGDLVSIAVLPIPIIGLVLLYQDILRSRMGLTDAQLLSQRDELLARL